jgi:DUF1680 family protein
MKKIIVSIFLVSSIGLCAQTSTESLVTFPLGSIQPTGWLKVQMQKDLNGFVGHLDELVPDLIQDPIYGVGRLHKQSKAKDLGNLKSGDTRGDEQYKWWNSETQSNWWDGYIRNAFLLQDSKGIEKVRNYVKRILATQDADGYLGIYDSELRYNFQSENGELWAKASLYRGLLAYYELTQDSIVLAAVQRAVANVMYHYPIDQSSPFRSGDSFNGGVSHGLTFTDILEKLYLHTREVKYLDYALFLYRDFSQTYQSESDAQLGSILNSNYRLKSHGVHTYEHLRTLIIARYASFNPEIEKALAIYLARIQNATTVSGAPIGDEWIAEREADATNTGYEYCSIHELLASYCLLYQKENMAKWGDTIEHLFFNAAQGARHPEYSSIAYLKTDNSYEMLGTKNGEIEPGRKQTRYKYSPVHQDVAVCCSPNAGRITPYFLQNAWMKNANEELIATLLMPCVLTTNVQGRFVQIENITQYPFDMAMEFKITQSVSGSLNLKIRKPQWAKGIETSEKYSLVDNFIIIHRDFATTDHIKIRFATEVQQKITNTGELFYHYGPLLYALPIAAKAIQDRTYKDGFSDYLYAPVDFEPYQAAPKAKAVWNKRTIQTQLVNSKTKKLESVTLIPFGNTVLRQLTFKK